jgi:hypothetical protein
VEEFFPFFDYMKDSRAKLPPRLISITMTEQQPTLLTVKAWPGGQPSFFGIEIYKDPHADIQALPALGAACPISEQSNSESCFAFIRNCLLSCWDHHEECKSSPSLLPRRVLVLQKSASLSPILEEDEFRIRLCETDGHFGYYAALNHCWGGDRIISALKSNITELQKDINWGDLPKTFQDAIVVALHFDIHFLWVDSLCIVQDDDDDRNRELAKLGEIYENAFLTIAATSSPSADIPFLRARPPEHKPKSLAFYGPRKAMRVANSEVCATVQARRTSRIAAAMNTASWSRTEPANNKVPGPLSTRGWALQERVLSTRIVHFTDEGIIWECRHDTQSEDRRMCLPSFLRKWEESKPTRRSRENGKWFDYSIT